MLKLFTLTFIDDTSLTALTNDKDELILENEAGISNAYASVMKDKPMKYICAFALSLSNSQYVSGYIDHVEEESNKLHERMDAKYGAS
jgi:hypothetical protein